MKKEVKFIYILVSADKYEFPRAVGDTIEDISRQSNLSWECLQRAFLRNSLIAGKYWLRRVNAKDLEFNFADYSEFCKTEGLKPGHAKSLQKFREYCGNRCDYGL